MRPLAASRCPARYPRTKARSCSSVVEVVSSKYNPEGQRLENWSGGVLEGGYRAEPRWISCTLTGPLTSRGGGVTQRPAGGGDGAWLPDDLRGRSRGRSRGGGAVRRVRRGP